MPARTTAIIVALLLTAGLSGCGSSPPTEFITLSAAASHYSVRPYAGPPIIVGRITLPPDLDRLSLVRRLHGNRLDINGIVNWAAPLDLLVRHTLAVDLAHRLPPGAVIIPGEPQPQNHALALTATFERFDVGSAGKVKLQAVWALVDVASGKTLLTHTSLVAAPAASISGGPIAAAISTALGKLSDAIVADIRTAKGLWK